MALTLVLLRERLFMLKKTAFTFTGIGIGVLVYGTALLLIYTGGHKGLWDEINPPYGTKKAYRQNILKEGRSISGKLYYASGPVVRVSQDLIEIKVRKFTNVKVGLDKNETKYYVMLPDATTPSNLREITTPLIREGDIVGLVYGNFQGKEVAYEIWIE